MALRYSKIEYKFIILLPIINALATVLTGYFNASSVNIGQLRALILLLYSFYFIFSGKMLFNSITKLLIFTLLYFLILVVFSSNLGYSFEVYLKYYIATFFFFIGYYFSKNPNLIKDISKPVFIALFFYLLNFILSNIFGLGFTSYSGVENKLYFGATGVNLAKHISVLLLLFPVLTLYKLNKFWAIFSRLLFFGGIIFVLFAFKRSAILTLVFGFLAFLYIVRDIKTLRKVLLIIFVFIIISPLILDQVIDNFNARQDSIYLNDSENLDKQARFTELQEVSDGIINGGPSYFFFGSEIFNSMDLFKSRRMLHTDYMTILSGTGIIGLFYFIFFYFLMYMKSRKRLHRQKKYFYRLFHGVSCALLVSLVILGFAGNIHAIEPRGTAFLFLGILYGSKFNLKYYKNKK